MTYQSTWHRAFAGAKMTAVAGVVAFGLAAAPAPAEAVTFGGNMPAGSWTGDPVVDLLSGPFTFTAEFTESDVAGIFEFNFLNTSAQKIAIVIKETTINQLSSLFFEGGVTTTFDGVDVFTPEKQSDKFGMNAVVNPGDTVQLLYDFGNPRGSDTAGPTIDFLMEASVVPLPAALVLFLSGLAGIGFLGRYNAKRRREEPAAA